MGWRKREWAFDEMSVKDGVIVRIDQALCRPYLSHYIDLLVIRLLQERIMPVVPNYAEKKSSLGWSILIHIIYDCRHSQFNAPS